MRFVTCALILITIFLANASAITHSHGTSELDSHCLECHFTSKTKTQFKPSVHSFRETSPQIIQTFIRIVPQNIVKLFLCIQTIVPRGPPLAS